MKKQGDTEKTELERKRGKRGAGRLYKRDGSGKEHKADSDKHGVFWLEYRVNGKRIRQRLLDEHGDSIKNIRAAKKARDKILRPLRGADKVEQLQTIQEKLSTAETELARAVEESNPPLSLLSAWGAYMDSTERPDSGEATLMDYEGYWGRFYKWTQALEPAPKYLRDITPKIAKDYAAALIAAKVSPNTYNKHTGFLRLFFRVLAEPARISENPFARDRIGRKKMKPNVRRELTIAELKDVLATATGDLQTLLFIGTFTGLRLGDCCTLKWGEVDLDRGLIRRIPNKTASKQKPVFVGIPAYLHAKLSETPPAKRKGYVLPKYAELYNYRSATGRPNKQPEITREIQAHFKAREIQTLKEGTGPGTGKRAVVEVSFHSLRHTYVSLHAEAGTPQAVVQSIVGHGSPAMTAHYSHIGEETARRVAGVLELSEEEPARAPLPPWARELIEGMTPKNLNERKKELLKKFPAGAR
jgi:integrase